jgi:uncharacterized SAM-binding protein YcdF (DUF218 family)
MTKNKRLLWIIGFLTIMGLIYISFLQVKIIHYSQLKASKDADYLIVLGARVKGVEPSLVLAKRINAAAKYLKENRGTVVIASGGKGPGEDISEAEAIKRELINQGINKSRILLENRSTDTYENIEFSKKLIPAQLDHGLVVTNTFHMYRALSIAHYKGVRVDGLAAPTPWSAVLKSYSREYLAITKFFLERYILGF